MGKITLVLVCILGIMPFLMAGKMKSSKSKMGVTWMKTKFYDGPCKIFKEDPNIDKEEIKEWQMKGLYYVMGSTLMYHTLTEALTGKSPEESSSETACYSRIFNKDHTSFLLRGYGTYQDYKCGTMPKGATECYPTEKGASPVWAYARGQTEPTWVWQSADKKYTLGFRCAGLYKIWGLRSTDKEDVDEDTKQKVLSFVKTRGFNPDFHVAFPQESCPMVEPYPDM